MRLSTCRLEGRPCLFESLEIELGGACRFEHKFLCRQKLFDSRMEVWNNVLRDDNLTPSFGPLFALFAFDKRKPFQMKTLDSLQRRLITVKNCEL